MNDHFDSIVKKLPAAYVANMGLEAITAIYNFSRNEAGLSKDEITPNLILGWHKYYSVEECCKKLGLNNCHTWDDVTEYYPVYDMMSDGAMLIAVE